MFKTAIPFAFAVLLTVCAFAEDSSKEKNSKPLDVAANRTQIQDINAKPGKWLNKKVTVRGQITKVGPESQTFVLDGDGIFNDQILVIGNKALAAAGVSNSAGAESGPMSSLVAQNERVMVTGTVRRMTLSQVQKTSGAQLGTDITAEWKATMPVLVVSDSMMVRRADESVESSASSTTRSETSER